MSSALVRSSTCTNYFQNKCLTSYPIIGVDPELRTISEITYFVSSYAIILYLSLPKDSEYVIYTIVSLNAKNGLLTDYTDWIKGESLYYGFLRQYEPTCKQCLTHTKLHY